MRAQQTEPESMAFQLAPMIDVIFILILFFMTSAGLVQVEKQLSITLPGSLEQGAPLPMSDEQVIEIADNGLVSLNGASFDAPDSRQMPQLVELLKRYKLMSAANKTPALATVAPSPKARYQRIIDVLDACAAAGISNVTFSAASE